jgi:hypothetical protein
MERMNHMRCATLTALRAREARPATGSAPTAMQGAGKPLRAHAPVKR